MAAALFNIKLLIFMIFTTKLRHDKCHTVPLLFRRDYYRSCYTRNQSIICVSLKATICFLWWPYLSRHAPIAMRRRPRDDWRCQRDGSPIGRAMCQLPCDDVHATIDDVDVTIDDVDMMIGDVSTW